MYAPGGSTRGIGHTLRSLALAEEAIAQGWDVHIAGLLGGPALSRARSVTGLHLEGALGDSALSELVHTADVLHLDTYDEWPSSLVPGDALLSSMVDDDYGRRACDLAIDTSPSAPQRAQHLRAVAGDVLLGPDFSPLAQRVRAVRGAWRGSEGEQPSVLVVMGGTDPFGLVVPVVAGLAALDPSPDVTVVRAAALAPQVEAAWGSAAGSLVGVEFVDDLVATACRHDLVISASGTTVWELAHAGVPMALVCAVDNQVDNYTALVDAGAAVGMAPRPLKVSTGLKVVADLLQDEAARVALSARGRTLVDGDGAWRVVQTWAALLTAGTAIASDRGSVSVRPATAEDSDQLLAWRNDPVTRSFSRDTGEVPRSAHEAWLARVLASEDRQLLVAEHAGVPVGTVRWDREPSPSYEQRWEVSITVGPDHRGRGLSSALIDAAERWLADQESGPVRLLATVHETNAASARLFHRAGYLPFGRSDEQGFRVLSRSL